MASQVKLIFFDIGGVLVHADLERYIAVGCALFGTTPEPLRREVLARVPELEKGRLDSATFWKEVGEGLWIRGEGAQASPEHCRYLWRDLMAATAQVDPQVVEVVERLEGAGVRLGALSNTLEDHVAVLTRMGVYRPFDPCVLSCRVGFRKPEPGIYLKAAEMAGLPPRECLLVDDRPENLEGARRVGMQGLLFAGAAGLARDLGRLRLL